MKRKLNPCIITVMAISNENINKKLKYLAELPESEHPFISLYLHVNAHELFEQAEKNRIFIKNSFQKIEKQANINKDRERILDFLENDLNSKAHGVAIFSCDKLKVFEVFHSIMPFENSFTVNSIPHLKQLAHHADQCENALLIITDKRFAKIYNIEIGGFVLDEADMEHDIHRFHKQGGWAQMRYQRHIKNQALHHYKEVAKVATEFLDYNRYDNLILAGQHHEIKNLQELLPKRVNTKIIDFNSLGIKSDVNQILESIINDLMKNERAKELAKVDQLKEKSPLISTTGWQDTIKLIEDGRVEMLVIPGYKTYIGWKCNGGLYITKEQLQAGCAESNHGLRKTDLTEEMVRLVFRANGKVELVNGEAAEKLEEMEGVGAIVRY